ncbi:MAG TPA: c-type cytochrome [Burkholderiales bacterium]|jgi:cytochrome c|nr:c-type cytochrome [Burkholderiales bacterium]
MKPLFAALAATAGLLFVQGAQAVDAKAAAALAQSSGCMTCHDIGQKKIGPAFKAVAAKYHGDKNAESWLIKKVTQGGSGVWGNVPMPPNAQVSEADIKTLVEWILSLK